MMRLGIALAVTLAASTAPLQAKPRHSGIVDFPETCPSDTSQHGILASLLGIVAKPVVEAGIKAFGNALVKAGARKDFALTAQQPSHFYTTRPVEGGYSVQPAGSCFVMAFGPEAGETGSTYGRWPAAMRTWAEGKGFTAPPAVYFEGKMVPSGDGTAFRVVPVAVWFGGPMGRRGIAAKERDIALTLSLITPGAIDDSNVVATRSIVFKNVASNDMVVTGLDAKGTSWIPMPVLGEAQKELLAAAVARKTSHAQIMAQIQALEAKSRRTAEENKVLAEARESKLRLARRIEKDPATIAKLLPFTTRVDMHETRDGNKLVASIGEFLTGSAGELAQPIVDRLDPEKRRTDALAEGTAVDALQTDVITKVAAWQAIEADTAATSAQKRVALIQAIAACRALRLNDLEMADCNTLPSA